MCTLTYLPIDRGYIVTQNRDESPKRGTPVFPYRPDDLPLVYPKDPDGEGTWIATDGNTVICVLNGAFEPHERKLPYRHSRGLLPLLAFREKHPVITRSMADGLEPFSVFVFSETEVSRYSWDGTELYAQHFDPGVPHIFQSAPLYSPDLQSLRSSWFEEWLEKKDLSCSGILDFHLNGGEGIGETDICMYRPGVQTTAVTQVMKSAVCSHFYYRSILSGHQEKIDL